MLLILVRHGHALNNDVDGLRVLSDEGKEQARQAGFFINELSDKPFKIYHSELLRAKETAQLIASKLGRSPEVLEDANLLPNSSFDIWENNLMVHEQTLALVGHMPFMGIFASKLLNRPMSFPTGGCLVLEKQVDDHWSLINSNF